jgi:3-deoxy-D-manno-octulosonic-acid transferase
MDYPGNAKKFIQLVKPKVAVFVKYEFWHHFIKELNQNKVPAFVISANFRPDQHFFKWYGSWFLKTLKLLQHIYVQSEDSRALLEKAGVTNATVGGDTRFDRVADVGEKDEELSMLSAFAKNTNVLVAGSTSSRIAGLMKALGMGAICYSEATEQKLTAARVLVIDSVGLLSKLYKYGSLAYIGGGFNAGIHNILEPAAFGLPVLFGPRYDKFREAFELISKGGAFVVNDYASLQKGVLFLLSDPMVLRMAQEMSRHYARENTGATARIMQGIQPV